MSNKKKATKKICLTRLLCIASSMRLIQPFVHHFPPFPFCFCLVLRFDHCCDLLLYANHIQYKMLKPVRANNLWYQFYRLKNTIKSVFFVLLRVLSSEETYLNKRAFEKLAGTVYTIPEITRIVYTIPDNN